VATRMIEYFDTLATFDVVGALVLGEDMGFKTQTLLSPEVYREYLFPWHAKLVKAVHTHGKPIILHSCGNLREIMDDIIDCGWDAKHILKQVLIIVQAVACFFVTEKPHHILKDAPGATCDNLHSLGKKLDHMLHG
ncbi:unnamed protein product, partial [marine sediment metagenome]